MDNKYHFLDENIRLWTFSSQNDFHSNSEKLIVVWAEHVIQQQQQASLEIEISFTGNSIVLSKQWKFTEKEFFFD